MSEGVGRFAPCEEDGVDYGFSEMRRDPGGSWVRYRSYADMKRARSAALRERDNAREKRDQARQEVLEELRERAAAKVKEAERRVAGERPQDRHERLKELLGSDWPVVTLMRDAGGKSSPPWVWWMEDNGYDHDKYEVEHYLPIAAFNTLLATLDPSGEQEED